MLKEVIVVEGKSDIQRIHQAIEADCIATEGFTLRKGVIEQIRVCLLYTSTKAWLRHYFEEQIYPVVTPLAVDSGHPFPFLANNTINAIVRIFQVQPCLLYTSNCSS